MKIIQIVSVSLALAICAACAPEPQETSSENATENAQAAFMQNLRALCGRAFAGKMVSSDEADADMADADMVMHVRECSDDEVRIPFYVGDDRSRTWVITETGGGLRLKHDHRHEDGSEDKVTWYGGDTADMGTATRQTFPVDQESIDLFKKEGLDQSVTNVWAVEVTDSMFAYELTRENRNFRVEFDTAKQVDTPLAPWGSEDDAGDE